MIDFTTLQGLTLPEGVVTQITDEGGRVIWMLANDEPAVLMVEKQSFTSYSGETAYSSECILLNIYPKTSNSTVNVTYGGLTKTLTFSGTNAQTVFFGTFNDVSDSVATPASGALTIEGGLSGFSCGTYSSTTKGITAYCSCITAVNEWGGVTSIGSHAFYGCTGLTSVTIPNSVTSIGSYAFSGCTGLTSVTIPNSVTSISVYAFNGCTNITNFSVDSDNKYYYSDGYVLIYKSNNRLVSCVVSPPSQYVIPSSVTSIGEYAFDGCSSLALTSLPNGITSIGSHAFQNCYALALTSLPNGITSIGSYAFNNCYALALTSLPSGLTSIEDAAFNNCYALALTSLPSGITGSIGASAFSCSLVDKHRFSHIALTSLPNGITSIGSYAFSGQFCITNITIPAGVTEIGGSAFYCSDYYGTQGLMIVTMLSTTPPKLTLSGSNDYYINFGKTSALPDGFKIIVPKGCASVYKADESWIAAGYTDYIVEVS